MSRKFNRLKPAPVQAVRLVDGFWAPRLETNRAVTLPSQYHLLESTGRIDNFRRAAGSPEIPFRGYCYNDSDIYKWLEAVGWTLSGLRSHAAGAGRSATGNYSDQQLREMSEAVIAAIAPAQREDGYLNTYFTQERAVQRWSNLRDMHELYCAGHLIQAALAFRPAGGGETLFQIAIRMADHIAGVFGPVEQGKRAGTPGHPEIEMALVELARESGAQKYLSLAQFFLDQRGIGLIGGSVYHQDHLPFRKLERMDGHAVRAAYLNAGAADLYAETGEPELLAALERMWENMTGRQMYISGGLGSRHQGESFGEDYELPNRRAYSETCAAIANVMWNRRMLQIAGEARFADVLELALYNGALAGISLDGLGYFYENPLSDQGNHRRLPWFACACCPTNIVRLLASLPGYFYSVSERGIWFHLYAANEAQLRLPGGQSVHVLQQTRYPWAGEIEVELRSGGDFSLFLRVPGWIEDQGISDKGMGSSLAKLALEINGKPQEEEVKPGEYLEVRRSWQAGDVIRLGLPMKSCWMESHPFVDENSGRVALRRGPLLYCFEGVDQPGIDLRAVRVIPGNQFFEHYSPGFLQGVIRIKARGEIQSPEPVWQRKLYRPFQEDSLLGQAEPVELTGVPYYAWANRSPGQMQVWMRI